MIPVRVTRMSTTGWFHVQALSEPRRRAYSQGLDTEGTEGSRVLPWASPGLHPADQQRPSQNMGQILSLPAQNPVMLPVILKMKPKFSRADRPSVTRPYSSQPPGSCPHGRCCPARFHLLLLQRAGSSPSFTQHGLFTPQRLLPMSPPKGPSPPTRSASGNSQGPSISFPVLLSPQSLLTRTSPTRLLAFCLRAGCKLREDRTAFRWV